MRAPLIAGLMFALVIPSTALGQKKEQASVRLSCPFLEPQPVKQVRPKYSELARTARIQGTVSLRCHIGKDGLVEKIEVIKGPPLLIPASIEAVSRWRYKPLVLNGEAVQAEARVDIIFKLPKEKPRK